MLLPKLAYRNILRQRRRSLLTGLSMSGGYILLCFSISLVVGSYGNMIDMFTRDHTGHVQVHFQDYLKRPRLYKRLDDGAALARELDANPEVVAYAPRVYTPALAYANDKSAPIRVVGIDPERERATSTLYGKVKEGEYLTGDRDDEGYFAAMIGFGIADSLRLAIGDEIVLISQGADGSIANDIFRVTALVGNRTSYEKQMVFLPLAAAREFLAMPEGVHEYAVLLADSDLALGVAEFLQARFADRDWVVSPWQEVEETFYKSMQADIRGNYVSLGIITFLVCIGVLNTVLMSVLERTREFGVLRAIGTDPGTITGMILLETCILALISCVIGILVSIPLVGWFTLEGITIAQEFDIGGITYNKLLGDFSLPIFLYPLATIIGATVVVSIPPAVRAARIVPVEALRSH